MNPANTIPAPVLEPASVPDAKWQREYQAFVRLLPELLQTYRNQYVAIHDGHVVASGSELVDVAMRAYAEHGYVPIYVNLVSDQPPAPVRLPTPRILQAGPT